MTSSFALAAASNAAARARKRVALVVGGAPRRAARDQPLELAPGLEQAQLAGDVDVGDEDAAAREDRDQPLAREPLQRFADRRAADAERAESSASEIGAARREPQRDDHLLDLGIGAIGEALRRSELGTEARWFIRCLDRELIDF